MISSKTSLNVVLTTITETKTKTLLNSDTPMCFFVPLFHLIKLMFIVNKILYGSIMYTRRLIAIECGRLFLMSMVFV